MSPKATYNISGLSGSFSKDNMNNQHHSVFQGDSSPLRPRAQSAPNMTIAVGSALVESYYQNLWFDSITPATYAGGNSSAISAPSTNSRIDLLYLNTSNILAWITGSESASPSAPNFTGDGIPICYVYCKTTMDRILNYEDKDTDATEGYIYRDIRPSVIQPRIVYLAGAQTIAGVKTFSSIPELPASNPTTANQAVRKSYADNALNSIKGRINFNGTGTIAINDSYNVSSIVDNGTGDYTINWDIDFANNHYALAGLCGNDDNTDVSRDLNIKQLTTALAKVQSRLSSNLADAQCVTVIATGDQA